MSTIYKLFSNIYEIFKILILIKYKKIYENSIKKIPAIHLEKAQKIGTNVSTKEDIKMTVKHMKGLACWFSW